MMMPQLWIAREALIKVKMLSSLEMQSLHQRASTAVDVLSELTRQLRLLRMVSTRFHQTSFRISRKWVDWKRKEDLLKVTP